MKPANLGANILESSAIVSGSSVICKLLKLTKEEMNTQLLSLVSLLFTIRHNIMHANSYIIYTWKFLLDKNTTPIASYLCITGILNFRECGKGCHILYTIMNS
jgi:hypothetical protein